MNILILRYLVGQITWVNFCVIAGTQKNRQKKEIIWTWGPDWCIRLERRDLFFKISGDGHRFKFWPTVVLPSQILCNSFVVGQDGWGAWSRHGESITWGPRSRHGHSSSMKEWICGYEVGTVTWAGLTLSKSVIVWARSKHSEGTTESAWWGYSRINPVKARLARSRHGYVSPIKVQLHHTDDFMVMWTRWKQGTTVRARWS